MRPAVDETLRQLDWMRREHIWPNGLRYLWTDAFGVVLLVSLWKELGDPRFLEEAERLVAEVDRVLGRRRGIRIGEEPERDGQYFHYLAMWIFALWRLGEAERHHRHRAIELVREIHPRFVVPEVGVVWKMREDLSGPYPGYGYGALDPFHGYVVYRLLAEDELATEIGDMRTLVEESYGELHVTQDLGLGMLLWMSHFFPEEDWAVTLRKRSLTTLDRMWIDPPGYFCREPRVPEVEFAFTNYGVAVGLEAVAASPERVERLLRFFATHRSHDEYDRSAITHVMRASAFVPGLLLHRPALS